jgi:hypothetical protein
MNRRTFFSSLIGAALAASTRWLPMPSAPKINIIAMNNATAAMRGLQIAGHEAGRQLAALITALPSVQWRQVNARSFAE